MMTFSGRWLVVVGLALVLTQAQGAPTPKIEPKPKEMPQAEYIRRLLDSKVNLEFSGTNLTAAVAQLSEDYRVNFVLDKAAVTAMGFDPNDLPVESKLKDVKLRTGLRTMMGQYGLSFAVVGDSILITTEEMGVYRQLNQRVNVDCTEVPLNKALKELALNSGVNIVIDPKSIKNKAGEAAVSLTVDDAPLEAVVRLMCDMANLKPVRMGNIIYVTAEDRADKLKDANGLMSNPMTNPSITNGLQFNAGVGGGLGVIVPGALPAAEVAPPGAPAP